MYYHKENYEINVYATKSYNLSDYLCPRKHQIRTIGQNS